MGMFLTERELISLSVYRLQSLLNLLSHPELVESTLRLDNMELLAFQSRRRVRTWTIKNAAWSLLLTFLWSPSQCVFSSDVYIHMIPKKHLW